MRLILKRFCDHRKQGVFGELYLDDELLAYTVEQPWDNNIPFKSCIPAGVYRISDWNSARFPNSLVMVNENLNVFKDKQTNEFARFACLMHPANWASNVQGCIGLGSSLGFGSSRWMVTNSRITTDKVLARIRANEVNYLQIQWERISGQAC